MIGVTGRFGTVACRWVLFPSPAEDVAEGDQRDDLLADLDGRPALDPVNLVGPDLDDLIDVVQRDRIDLVVDPHQQAGHDRQRQRQPDGESRPLPGYASGRRQCRSGSRSGS